MTAALLLLPAVVIGAFAMLLGTTWLERLIGVRAIGTVGEERDRPRPRRLTDAVAASSQ